MVSVFETRKATVCSNPDEYLFWDQVHATARVHRIASGYICKIIREQGYQIDCPDLQWLREHSDYLPNNRLINAATESEFESQPGA